MRVGRVGVVSHERQTVQGSPPRPFLIIKMASFSLSTGFSRLPRRSSVSLLESLPPSPSLSLSLITFSLALPTRPEPHGRRGASQPGQADSPVPEQDEEILGSDDDEQEDPNDYCRGTSPRARRTSRTSTGTHVVPSGTTHTTRS